MDTPASDQAKSPEPEPKAPQGLLPSGGLGQIFAKPAVSDPPVPFDTVHRAEVRQIEERREEIFNQVKLREKPADRRDGSPFRLDPNSGARTEAKKADTREKSRRIAALDRHLAGVAFSGGGIRSATFAVGVIQALAHQKILTRFDYLSTVSGGGYAGAWLTAWLKREGDVLAVQDQLSPSRVRQQTPDRVEIGKNRIVDEEPEPLHHLRSFSNYLAPWKGVLTADTWTLLSIYTRNTLVNFLLLLPLTLVCVLLIWGLIKFYGWSINLGADLAAFAFYTFFTLLAVAFGLIGREIALLGNARAHVCGGVQSKVHKTTLVNWIMGILVICAILATWLFSINPPPRSPDHRIGMLTEADWQIRVATDSHWLSFANGLQPGGRAAFAGLIQWVRGRFGRDPKATFLGRDLDNIAPRAFTDWDSGGIDWFSGVEFAILFGLFHLVAHSFGYAGYYFSKRMGSSVRSPRHRQDYSSLWAVPRTTLASGATGGVLFYILISQVLWHRYAEPWAVALLVPPLAIGIFFVAVAVEVWLLGRWQEEDAREWWARFCAWLLIIAVAWLVVFATVACLPPLFQYLSASLSSVLTPAAVIGWLATSAGGALAGRNQRADGTSRGSPLLVLLGRLAPVVFLLGLLALVSVLAGVLVRPSGFEVATDLPPGPPRLWEFLRGYGDLMGNSSAQWVAGYIAGSAFLALFAGYVSDANLFSLHSLYANRLIRCYLGASRPATSWDKRSSRPKNALNVPFAPKLSEFGKAWNKRAEVDRAWLPGAGGAPTQVGALDQAPDDPQNGQADPTRRLDAAQIRQENEFTGFDLDDDFALRKLTIGLNEEASEYEKKYYGPFPVINTALNLVAGKELAWKDRKAESFTLTPLYAGSKRTWYRRLRQESDPYVSLGRSVAISGAAADPNMGAQQTAPLTALMTVFNARLGWWLKNPRFDNWRGEGPGLAWPVVWELLGWTDEDSEYIHLSDGGHFENLGVYELVRRRCRYIVACDAGQDPNFAFEDLANLIRLCRIDFGVRIDIDVDALRPKPGERASQQHVAIGKIGYDDVDGGEVPGVLIYIKASLSGDEPTDVETYAGLHKEFPHQTTANQFFDEAQFESYRALGYHIGTTVIGEAVAETREELWTESEPDLEFVRGNRKLFSAIARRWSTLQPSHAEFTNVAEPWLALQDRLLSEAQLRGLSYDLYPEIAQTSSNGKSPEELEPKRVELHAVAQMLQILEDAWLQLGLGGDNIVSMNRGWMSVFRRWTSTAAFRRHWPVLRAEFSTDFVRFCESELRLRAATRVEDASPWEDSKRMALLDSLNDEFRREWPRHSLVDLIAGAEASREPKDAAIPWCWVTYQASTLANDGAAAATGFPCGVAFVTQKSEGDYEFFVWLRRPFRSMGIGSRHAGDIFGCFCKAIWETHPDLKKIRVTVKYPPAKRFSGGGFHDPDPPTSYSRANDAEYNLWRSFFGMLDFRPEPRDQDFRPDEEVVLSREFFPPPKKTSGHVSHELEESLSEG